MRPGLWVGGSLVPPAVVPILLAYVVVAGLWLRRARRARARDPADRSLRPTVERVLLLGAVVLTGAATLTPPAVIDYPELFGPDRRCRLHAPDLTLALLEGQRLLNVLLLVPVGLLGVLVARRLPRAGRVLVIGAVLVLPALVEALQWAFPAIRRACDATDLADNYLGVGAGLLAGLAELVLRWAARRKGGRVAP